MTATTNDQITEEYLQNMSKPQIQSVEKGSNSALPVSSPCIRL